ncbi:MAG TPA: hypothetical protein VLS88_12385 [Polyangiales bacterium]|nr:hypothetical protein [Polyangiales bacterium]
MKRRRRSREEWGEICRAFHASGKTRVEFARQQGLKWGTLCYWLSKLRTADDSVAKRAGFVEVFSSTGGGSPRAVVHMGCIRIEFFSEMPPTSWLAELASRC